jgi:hypothetical protein
MLFPRARSGTVAGQALHPARPAAAVSEIRKRYIISMVIAWIAFLTALTFVVIWALR